MPQADHAAPRLDDLLKHETASALTALPDGGRDDLAVALERRSMLAELLAGATYPATGKQLADVVARANGGPDANPEVIAEFAALPARRRFATFGSVWDALGGADLDEQAAAPRAAAATPANRRTAKVTAPSSPPPTTSPERRRFEFDFDRLFTPFATAFGIRDRAWVAIDDDELEIRFGPWVLRTERANVAGCEISGPYNLLKVIGPPRLSFADRGVTFATNRRRGVCIDFHEPVPAMLPVGLLAHPGATVTVDDPEALVAALAAATAT